MFLITILFSVVLLRESLLIMKGLVDWMTRVMGKKRRERIPYRRQVVEKESCQNLKKTYQIINKNDL